MRYELYTIVDLDANQAGPVFQAVNDAVARRNYRGLLQQVAKVDQEAYKLYRIGSFDDKLMFVDGLNGPPVEVDTGINQRELELKTE